MTEHLDAGVDGPEIGGGAVDETGRLARDGQEEAGDRLIVNVIDATVQQVHRRRQPAEHLGEQAVAECGVIGVPDEERGMVVKAICVLKPGYQGDATMVKTLQDHVKATIAPFKYPRVVEFVTALPRTETGKLQRFKLRQEK